MERPWVSFQPGAATSGVGRARSPVRNAGQAMTLTELRYLVNLDKERGCAPRPSAQIPRSRRCRWPCASSRKNSACCCRAHPRRSRGRRRWAVSLITQARRVLVEAKSISRTSRAKARTSFIWAAPSGGDLYVVGLLPAAGTGARSCASWRRRCRWVIEENFTAMLLEQLRVTAIELDGAAVLALPVDLQGLSVWALYDEDFVVLLPPEHRWASARHDRRAGSWPRNTCCCWVPGIAWAIR